MQFGAGDKAWSMDHTTSGRPKRIAEFLYICIIEEHSGCA
jgi:hypothetical protein